MEISTDGQHHWCLSHHGLIEMGRCQTLLHRVRACHHHAIQLEIAHGLCASSLSHEAIQKGIADGLFTIFADSTTGI